MRAAKRSKWQPGSSLAAPLQPLVIVLLVRVVDAAVVDVVPEPLLLLPRVATAKLSLNPSAKPRSQRGFVVFPSTLRLLNRLAL